MKVAHLLFLSCFVVGLLALLSQGWQVAALAGFLMLSIGVYAALDTRDIIKRK